MKLLFLLVVTAFLGVCAYVVSFLFLKDKKKKKFRYLPLGIAGIVVVLLLGVISFGLYSSKNQPDLQCSKVQTIVSPPTLVPTANGYFKLGDFYYEHGNCQQAITAYTKAIALNSQFAQAYNNRGYTYMRMREYNNALQDLNKAIEIKPDYINALINRGDLSNYYGPVINRQIAISDYKKAIALGATQATSVCGHLFLAKHNGWTLGAYIGYFTGEWASCK